MPDVITANRLADGVVVFQTADDGWSEDFNRAAVWPRGRGDAAALARAKQDEADNLVVEPYAVPVELRNGHVAPKALREAIRARGADHPARSRQAGAGPRAAPGPTAVMEADHVSL